MKIDKKYIMHITGDTDFEGKREMSENEERQFWNEDFEKCIEELIRLELPGTLDISVRSEKNEK